MTTATLELEKMRAAAEQNDYFFACEVLPLLDRIRELEEALAPLLVSPRWLSIGSVDNTAEIRVSRTKVEKALSVLAGSG